METTLAEKVRCAVSGDKQALDDVIFAIKDLVYNLSLRMLLYPSDAQDASQEILIIIITKLSTFRHESKFTTWVYRVSTNYLLTAKGKKSKAYTMPFDAYAEMIDQGQTPPNLHIHNKGELFLLEEEVKVSCTHGLLLCLDQRSRMVYILSEIMEFNAVEGADIMQITAVNFRKILSRSREKIRNFLSAKCGLANPKNPCRCKNKIEFLMGNNGIDKKQLKFAQFKKRSIDLVNQISELQDTAVLYRTTPQFSMPNDLLKAIRSSLNLL